MAPQQRELYVSETDIQNKVRAARSRTLLTAHLARLEAESIYILREAAAEFVRPTILYSIGKDSSVLLHLAIKAFARAGCRFRCCTSTRRGSSAT